MSLVAGTRLGPYEIQSAIGAGGMGEVYKARDTRLDRDVAIKVLPDDIAGDADRLRRFEEEARAVAALNHPNILTVHDVGAQDGTSFVVTELLEGETLREVLCRRLPTQRQLLSVAVQAADGIAAAHRKGIVHRDLKPENLFVTTDGRVKILDFGLAKRTGTRDGVDATTEGVTEPGVLMGTVAYMSPEQARGEAVGLASDVFSFGVVLYELLTRRHPFRRETVAATLSAILHETPSRPSNVEGVIPPALDGVVRRCLEKDQTERFATGHDLAVALEAVLQAPSGAVSLQEVEERSPYPGLRSFSEKDARVFFGREAEVTALWDRIGARRLLAVIGPSGAGKTSFLRAGVIPARPDEWTAIACTPGPAPLRGLGQALGPALAADHEALSQLAGFEDPDTAFTLVSRWRAAHGDALLVVDQFEEVYTLNPPEMQARFATLLARLASEADVHVVLSLRDDFLMRCHDHPCLAALFDGLTPLGALTHEGLCRALMEPAARLGYRFEDAALVEDMVACVEGARAALPLLAFAVSRLWEQRDRERKVLTRAAYENIGGVAGALAQHAEATLDRIGSARQALVREVFRNLVTAQGTRAVVDRDELLSAFSDRTAAEAVLGELVDARLLTSYEVEGREGEPNRHRIEIVHESLLKAWPRLVRWQTQDEEGAQLRDQLKQAARLWTEKRRSADLLWTGTAYREYALWRERYTAPLTAVENAFAVAMAARAKRTKRVRTAAVGALVVGLTAVAIVIGISRQTAVESGRRAEASKLVALGRLELDRDPSATVAYARKSLEMSDTAEARLLALEAVWRGPTARVLATPNKDGLRVDFAGDGSRLACSGFAPDIVVVESDGRIAGRFTRLPAEAAPRDTVFVNAGRHLLTWTRRDDRVRLLDLDGHEVRSFPGEPYILRLLGDGSFVVLGATTAGSSSRVVRRWSLQGGAPSVLDTWKPPPGAGSDPVDLDPGLRWLAYGSGNRIFVHQLGKAAPDRLLGQHTGRIRAARFDADGARLLSADEHGTLRLWSMPGGEALWMRSVPPVSSFSPFSFDRTGRQLAWATADEGTVLLQLDGPPDASPLLLRRADQLYAGQSAFSADGLWMATANEETLSVWPLTMPYARVLNGHSEGPIESLAFSPDSRSLVSCARDGARVWPLADGMGVQRRIDIGSRYMCYGAAVSPDGRQVAVASPLNGLFLAPIDGGPARRLIDFAGRSLSVGAMAFDAAGTKLALAGHYAAKSERMEMYVVDLPSRAVRTLPLLEEPSSNPEQGAVRAVAFSPDGSLLTAGDGGIRRWSLPAGTNEVVAGGPGSQAKLAADRIGNWVVVALGRGGATSDSLDMHLSLLDLGTGALRPVQTHGDRLQSIATDPGGKWLVSGDRTGVTRVGSTSGKEPHVLPGHSGPVNSAAVSPDGKWVASASGREIRLWPIPDLSKPPLHTLPHDLLIAKLESLTNLRVVRDVASPTGWKIEVGPFPGWKNVPTW